MERDVNPQGAAVSYHVGGHGEPVLLLTDAAEDAASWVESGYVRALAHTCRLIAIDAIPCSPIGSKVDRTVAVLDRELLPDAHLWAYGSSARLAYAVAARHPRRVASLIIGGFGFERAAERRELRALSASAVIYCGAEDPAVEWARRDAAELGAPFAILTGLDHAAACDAVAMVAPLVASHLLAVREVAGATAPVRGWS